MSSDVKVSVITPTWNRGNYLPECIDSVLAQEFPGVEHVIVDDGSTDDTPGVLASYAEKHPGVVRTFRQENAGQSAAWNRCVAEARGEYFAFLDSDDAWIPGKLARQVPLLDAQPEAGLLYAAVEYIDAEGNPSPVRQSGRGTPEGWILPHLLKHNVMNTGTVVVRSDLVRKAGDFDSRYVSVNDWDMWLRVCIDTEVVYDPTPSCLMRRHDDQIIADKGKMDAAWVELLENNLVRLEDLGPQHIPLARRRLARHYVRRARRALREERRDDADRELLRAVELDSGVRAHILHLRLSDGFRRLLGRTGSR
ncbi:MAG: glycosyltransferase [Planctomycetota bacterium]|jgi:glycosyltransferase involved in cell wall biosynthesis